jgi:hypothetical protein
MSTGIKVLIGAAIAFGSLIVVGILTAIAIPVFLDQRAKGAAEQTTVSIPSTAAGLALRTDAISESLVEPLRTASLPGTHLAGAYGGSTRPEALVTITKRYMSPEDQRDYMAGGAREAAKEAGLEVTSPVPAGPLGGKARCCSSASMTICFFVDSGAYGTVVVFGTPERGLELLPQLRAAVEHRA